LLPGLPLASPDARSWPAAPYWSPADLVYPPAATWFHPPCSVAWTWFPLFCPPVPFSPASFTLPVSAPVPPGCCPLFVRSWLMPPPPFSTQVPNVALLICSLRTWLGSLYSQPLPIGSCALPILACQWWFGRCIPPNTTWLACGNAPWW
jgi:hypothetical protein